MRKAAQGGNNGGVGPVTRHDQGFQHGCGLRSSPPSGTNIELGETDGSLIPSTRNPGSTTHVTLEPPA